jgi:site-specific DNA recombinase
VAVREIEAFIVERIKSIGKDPGLVRETIKASKKQLESRKPGILVELRRHEKDREKLDRERRHLVDAVGTGKASPAILQRLGEQDLLAQSLEAQVAKLKDELAAMESKVIDEADLQAALASFTPVWEELFPAERARILQLLIERVTYDAKAGEVEIVFRPGGVRTLAANAGKETA